MTRLEHLKSLHEQIEHAPLPHAIESSPPLAQERGHHVISAIEGSPDHNSKTHLINDSGSKTTLRMDATSAKDAHDPLEATLQTLHVKLVDAVDAKELNKLTPDERRAALVRIIGALLDSENVLLNAVQRRQVVEDLLDEVLGLGPLEKLLRDPLVSDILVNGASRVYVERRGRLEHSSVHFRDDEHLLEIIRRIVSQMGRRVDESSPMVDARLPDGSRVNAIIPPLALTGPMLSIRRFGANRLRMEDLISLKALPSEMAQLLEAAVQSKLNLIISGGTGSGKTTLLNALSAYIPADERVITIEDAAELRLQQEHVGQLESRPANMEGEGEITIRDLVRNALRMRPNRIIVGECRGAEALDMLQAMNTGHEGSMSTLHANSPRDALSRLEMMIMMTGLDLPLKAIRQQIASSIHFIVQVGRLTGGARKITSITEVVGMEQETISLQEIFLFRQTGLDLTRRAIGHFETTGIRPVCEARIAAAGVRLPDDLFRQRVVAGG